MARSASDDAAFGFSAMSALAERPVSSTDAGVDGSASTFVGGFISSARGAPARPTATKSPRVPVAVFMVPLLFRT
jgi:hypothetical protein